MTSPFPTQDGLVIQPGTLDQGKLSEQDKCHMVLDYVSELQKEFAERDRVFDKIEDVIFLNQKVQIPENFKNSAIEVRSPLPTHIANSITAALSINTPKVSFEPTEIGDLGQDIAAYRQAFFQNAWKRQMLDKNRRLYRLFMYSVVTKGIGVLKTTTRRQRAWAQYEEYGKKTLKELEDALDKGEIDQDTYTKAFDSKTEDYKKSQPYPIETTDVDPGTFYYQNGENGMVRCAEVASVPYYETLKRFGGALDARGQAKSATDVSYDSRTGLPLPDTQWHKTFGGADSRTIQKIELWDTRNCYVIIRGPGDIPSKGAGFVGSGWLARTYPHNYGNSLTGALDGPYFMSSGIVTPSRRHERTNLSVLFAYLHLFPLLNSLLTMQSQAAFTFAYPAYKRTTPPTFGMTETPFGFDAREIHENKRTLVPGAIFPSDISAMDQPRSGIDLEKAISFIVSMLERILPDSVQGIISGETAGYALNQATHLATLAWSPILDNSKVCLSSRVGFESRLIERNIGETVYVRGALPRPKSRPGYRSSPNAPIVYKDGWIGIGPKQLGGYHEYDVDLVPVSVNNDALVLRNLREELDLRLIDPDSAVRLRGRNPKDVERAWRIYEIKRDPAIDAMLKQRIFRRLATMDQQEMLGVPEGGEVNGPPAPVSGQPAGAAPGISQGAPTTGFVPPQVAVPVPQAPAMAPPMSLPRPSGTPAGEPGGVRGVPAVASPTPGG